jgi:hypothetical protein
MICQSGDVMHAGESIVATMLREVAELRAYNLSDLEIAIYRNLRSADAKYDVHTSVLAIATASRADFQGVDS